jgi:hypothetical protein
VDSPPSGIQHHEASGAWHQLALPDMSWDANKLVKVLCAEQTTQQYKNL